MVSHAIKSSFILGSLIGGSTSSPLNRFALPGGRRKQQNKYILKQRATIAEVRLLRRTRIAPEKVYLSRSARECGENKGERERRGTILQPQVQAPYVVSHRYLGGNPGVHVLRLARPGEMLHRAHRGGSRQGRRLVSGSIQRGTGVSRRTTFRLTEIVPRIRLRYGYGTHQPRQLETLRKSLTSGAGEAVHQGQGNQDVKGDIGGIRLDIVHLLRLASPWVG